MGGKAEWMAVPSVEMPPPPQLPPLDIHHPGSFSAAFHDIQPAQSPPQALRKSLSVDSLVAATPRPQKEPPSPPARGFVAGLASAFRRESSTDLRSPRNRGASVSSVRDKQPQAEPDADRHPLPDRDHRFRRPSLRGSDHSKPTVRGGELPLPARTPTSPNDLPTTGIFSDPTDPAQNQPLRRSSSTTARSGRSRSISNSAQSQQPPQRMTINTQFPSVCKPYIAPLVLCKSNFS
jgi:hypothetical protein